MSERSEGYPSTLDTADSDYWSMVREEVGWVHYNGSQAARDRVAVNIQHRAHTIVSLRLIREHEVAEQVAEVKRIVAAIKAEGLGDR